jgi:hypothetical protein
MYDKRKRITPAERTSLKIASINSKYFDVKWPNTQLSAGKQIYSGKEGRLQTILYIHKDTKEQGVEEFLVSYDSSGNPVDCILIAAISAYWGDAGEGTIEGNTVNALYVDRSEGTNYRIYQISPGLKFVKVKEGE